MDILSFQKILVPVDFSPHSERAVRIAANLSQRYLASLTLVHVHLPPVSALAGAFVFQSELEVDRLFAELRKQLEAEADIARSFGASSVATQIVTGVPASAVCDLANDEGFDLIVMGTHGRTGLDHALMGSVAERVVRLAPCPVLTLRAVPPSK